MPTKDAGKLTNSQHKRTKKISVKPDIILSYNKCKQGIDLADQIASYHSPVRKSIRWFHKVAFDVLLNTAVVNAYILYRSTNDDSIKIDVFREIIIKELINLENTGTQDNEVEEFSNDDDERYVEFNQASHKLIKKQIRTKSKRLKHRRCKECYKELLYISMIRILLANNPNKFLLIARQVVQIHNIYVVNILILFTK